MNATKERLLIPLTQGRFATVDEEDYDWLSQWSWCLNTKGYAVRGERRDGTDRAILMHRQILGLCPGDGLKSDHRNHDRLDNRRANLRICTNAQNVAYQHLPRNNTSGYKGVSWSTVMGKWEAYICAAGRKRNLGYYIDPVDAARAYDRAAVTCFGEFARPNLPVVEI